MFAPPTSPPAALPPPAPWSRAAYTSRRARPSTRAQRTARPPAHSRGNPDSARNRSRLSPTRPKMLPGRTILRRERKSDCAESGGLPDQGTIPSANTHLQRQSPAEAGLCRSRPGGGIPSVGSEGTSAYDTSMSSLIATSPRAGAGYARLRSQKRAGVVGVPLAGGVNLQVGPAVSSGPTSCLSYGFLGLLPP
jgi:hypothetical protein